MKRFSIFALAVLAASFTHAQQATALPEATLRLVTQGTTSGASTLEATIRNPGRLFGQERLADTQIVLRVRVCNSGTFATSTNATIAAGTNTSAVETHASTKDLTFRANAPAKATATLTSDNTNVTNGDTVTIGVTTYTFRTTLTPLPGEVLIGGSADASLLNLIRAINHSGTPGTDYQMAGQNLQASAATSVTSHAFAITATSPGSQGNRLPSVESSSHLSFGGSTFSGGTDPSAIRFTLTDATAETVTVRVGPASVGSVAGDYSAALQVTHAP